MLNFEENNVVNIFKDLNSINRIPNPVITIGTFDGVHLGHQKIIQQLNKEARRVDGESVLFTFYPHPRMVLFPNGHGIKLIQTEEEKLSKLKRFGLQNIIVYPFTPEFSQLTALDFVRNILVDQLHVKILVIGYDHQFGKDREGNIDYLKKLNDQYEFEVIEISPKEVDEVNVSSTKIRESILSGDIDKANSFLGEPFELSGKVVHGDAIGRTLGFPTANIHVEEETKLIPGNGVYAVEVLCGDFKGTGMLNIGIRPTLNLGLQRKVEVNIFDFDQEIYNETITVRFLARIRDEKRFGSMDELKDQLVHDEKTVRTRFVSCN